MYSLKNQRCHAIACLPSKLETGCRQLLHKLESCKETETKGRSEEIRSICCSQESSWNQWKRILSGSSWGGGGGYRHDKQLYGNSRTSPPPSGRAPSFKTGRATVSVGGGSAFRMARAVSHRYPHTLQTPTPSQEWQPLEAQLTNQKVWGNVTQNSTGSAPRQEHKCKTCKSERSMCPGKCCFFTREEPDTERSPFSWRRWGYSSPPPEPTAQQISGSAYARTCWLHQGIVWTLVSSCWLPYTQPIWVSGLKGEPLKQRAWYWFNIIAIVSKEEGYLHKDELCNQWCRLILTASIIQKMACVDSNDLLLYRSTGMSTWKGLWYNCY